MLRAKLTWQALGPFERPEIRRAICMADCVKLLEIIKIDVNVTRRNTAISYFLRYLGN